MNKTFSSSDVKRLINRYNALISELENLEVLSKRLARNVKSASSALLEYGRCECLRKIPVESLVRLKPGLNTKTLKDHGIASIYDVNQKTVAGLARVKGISTDSATVIKKLAEVFAEEAKKDVRIKLNADDRNAAATKLVKAICAYKEAASHIEACKRSYALRKEQIIKAIGELKPAANDFKWFFTSSALKKKAIAAYDYLLDLTKDAYLSELEKELALIGKAKEVSAKSAWKDFQIYSVNYWTLLEKLCPGAIDDKGSVYGLSDDIAHEIEGEEFSLVGLSCSLRRYQVWGVKYILHQKKVLLGDEMGLGKTVQAIASMVALKNDGATHFMVVCPASVLTNWQREITKHSDLPVTVVHGKDKDADLQHWMESGGVAVTTYETTTDFAINDDFRFSLLVVDEAHYIKNPEAQRTISTVGLSKRAERILLMTGTALENRVDEMIALVRVINPDIADELIPISFLSFSQQFQDKIAPVYYRRKRETVLTELPELTETKEWCKLSEEEEKAYEQAVLEKRFSDARKVSWNIDDVNNSSKAQRLKWIVDTAAEEGRKIIVFSYFLETVRKVNEFLGERCVGTITGSVSAAKRQEIIDDFDKATAGSVLVAQIQSGGTGLNIQSASVVVICEPQFKPSIENQAISRAYRMGQSRNVLVYRLLCDDTVDEKVCEMLDRKQKLFDAFADESVAAQESIELDEKTFGAIIEEEIKRITAKHEEEADSAKLD